MKNLKMIFALTIGLTIISACSKENGTPETTLATPTTLELTIQDNLGNIVSGASVGLFSSSSDLQSGTNQIGSTKTTNSLGKVIFTNVSNIKYYWYVEKGCMNNYYGVVTSETPLTLNASNSMNVIIAKTGTFQFICSSNNPYRIYINGQPTYDINGNSIINSDMFPAGNYTIRVLQKSGYLVYPTDETYNVKLDCGESQSVLFPQSKKSDS